MADHHYDRNYVHGPTELERLIDASKRELAMVRVPTLVVQADKDPVIDPASGRRRSISSPPTAASWR